MFVEDVWDNALKAQHISAQRQRLGLRNTPTTVCALKGQHNSIIPFSKKNHPQ